MERRGRNSPRRVTVIGLGRFGDAAARTLADLGYEVTAIDVAERKVADVADAVTLAAQGDGTDEELLRSLAVDQSDVAIVGQGENVEASVLTTLVLKRMGVPWVVAKAETLLHGEVLARIGADHVVYPERAAAVRLAHALTVRNVADYMSLSDRSGVALVAVPLGRAPVRLAALAADPAIAVLLIKRGEDLLVAPAAEEPVRAGDTLVVAGPDAAIDRFADACAVGR